MKSFTKKEVKEGISLLSANEKPCAAIDVPLQKMFDELLTFISLADLE